MTKYIWVYDPQNGEGTIPKNKFEEIKSRIIIHMKKIAPNLVMDIKLKSQFCYVNTVEDSHIMSVCRIRYLILIDRVLHCIRKTMIIVSRVYNYQVKIMLQ